MIVIPLNGDKIRTKDDGEIRHVTSYTNLKIEPAVYLKTAASKENFVSFEEIIEINGVKVEYSIDSKVFTAYGPLMRKYNIPQPKDIIKVKLQEVNYKNEIEELTVTALKLHNKRLGPTKGLYICCKEGEFTINEILGIDRTGWAEAFDVERFRKYYFDYFPIKFKL